MANVANLHVKIGADIAGLQKSLQMASAKIGKFGTQMSAIGSSLTTKLTLPILAAGGASLKMAMEFEASMTKIETLVGLAGNQVEVMSGQVLELSKKTGIAANSLSEALFTVTSAGSRGAEAMEILTAASKASAAGLGETQAVARAVTASIQAYGSENLSAAKATDVFTAIVREGNLEAERLAPVLGRVIGIASQAGVSFEEVGASIATYTRLGVSAEEATTGLRSILSAIVKPTEQSKKALSDLGMSFDDLRKMVQEKGLAESLTFLVESYGDNTEALSMLIPNVEGFSAVLGTAGAQGEAYRGIVKNITNSQGLLDEAFERTTQTTQFKFNEALTSARTIAIQLGKTLLPLATDILSQLSTAMNALSVETLKVNMKYAALVAAAGPAILAMGKITLAVRALTIAMMANPIGAFIKLVVTLGAVAQVTGSYVRDMAKAQLASAKAMGVANGTAERSVLLQTRIRDLAQELATGDRGAVRNEQIRTELAELSAQLSENEAMLRANIEVTNANTDATNASASATGAAAQAYGTLSEGIEINANQIEALVNSTTALTTEQSNELASLIALNRALQSQIDLRIKLANLQADGVDTGIQQIEAEPIRIDTSNSLTSLEFLRKRVDSVALSTSQLGEQTDKVAVGFEILAPIAENFTDSFGAGMANIVVQGERLQDVLKNIGKLLLSSAIQTGIKLLLSGGLTSAGTGFFGSGGGLFGKIFGVNDALITSQGDVVKFHPDDNILAMKDFGNLQPSPVAVTTNTMDEGVLMRAFSSISWELRGDKLYAVSQRGGLRYER